MSALFLIKGVAKHTHARAPLEDPSNLEIRRVLKEQIVEVLANPPKRGLFCLHPALKPVGTASSKQSCSRSHLCIYC